MSPDVVKRVTRRLAEIRRENRVTQESLAELLDLPVQHVRRVEAGQNITLETLARFAMALGVEVDVGFVVSKRGPRRPPPSKRQRSGKKRTVKKRGRGRGRAP